MLRPKNNDPRKTTVRKKILLSHVERKWSRMSNYLVRISIVLALFMVCYWICDLIDSIQLFQALFWRIGFSVGGRPLSLLMLKVGCSMGLALAIGFAVKALLTSGMEDAKMMMAPSGGEGTVGGSPGWTSIFGSSEMGGSEPSVNQPTPDSPEPASPAAPLALPDLQPLQEDGERRQELGDRLDINSLRRSYTMEVRESIIETQLQIERKIEEALRSDGYSEQSLLAKRHQIRGFLFYPRGTALSETTYERHLEEMDERGTRESVPYRRILKAINNLDLLLDRRI